jgi:hypothetical protein
MLPNLEGPRRKLGTDRHAGQAADHQGLKVNEDKAPIYGSDRATRMGSLTKLTLRKTKKELFMLLILQIG